MRPHTRSHRSHSPSPRKRARGGTRFHARSRAHWRHSVSSGRVNQWPPVFSAPQLSFCLSRGKPTNVAARSSEKNQGQRLSRAGSEPSQHSDTRDVLSHLLCFISSGASRGQPQGPRPAHGRGHQAVEAVPEGCLTEPSPSPALCCRVPRLTLLTVRGAACLFARGWSVSTP